MTDKRRENKKCVKEYNAKQFFDSRYDKMPEFRDQYTLSPTTSSLAAVLHYKRIELNIIKGLIRCQGFCLDGDIENACDIGSGTGHLVKFLLEDLNAKNIVAIELSAVACKQLECLFSDYSNISIVNIDICSDRFKYKDYFDLVTGIATFHHIVNDQAWESSLCNVSSSLKAGGIALITDNCGFWTRSRTFINSSEFFSWRAQDHKKVPSKNVPYLMKKSRSLRLYKSTFQKYDCNVERVIWNKGRKFLDRLGNQFNLMIIRKN